MHIWRLTDIYIVGFDDDDGKQFALRWVKKNLHFMIEISCNIVVSWCRSLNLLCIVKSLNRWCANFISRHFLCKQIFSFTFLGSAERISRLDSDKTKISIKTLKSRKQVGNDDDDHGGGKQNKFHNTSINNLSRDQHTHSSRCCFRPLTQSIVVSRCLAGSNVFLISANFILVASRALGEEEKNYNKRKTNFVTISHTSSSNNTIQTDQRSCMLERLNLSH